MFIRQGITFLMSYFHPKPTPNNHTRFIVWYAFSIRDAFPHPTFISVPMLKLSLLDYFFSEF